MGLKHIRSIILLPGKVDKYLGRGGIFGGCEIKMVPKFPCQKMDSARSLFFPIHLYKAQRPRHRGVVGVLEVFPIGAIATIYIYTCLQGRTV